MSAVLVVVVVVVIVAAAAAAATEAAAVIVVVMYDVYFLHTSLFQCNICLNDEWSVFNISF